MGKVEIEVKVAVSNLESVKQMLIRMGGELIKKVKQVDIYFTHPCRDFAITDEALRLRLEEDSATLTYKGPKIGLVGKSRIEIGVRVSNSKALIDILKALGFKPVFNVVKLREVYVLKNRYKVSLDDVEDLGFFVEVELIGSYERVREAETELLNLLKSLGIESPRPIRKSYLELLLAKKGLI